VPGCGPPIGTPGSTRAPSVTWRRTEPAPASVIRWRSVPCRKCSAVPPGGTAAAGRVGQDQRRTHRGCRRGRGAHQGGAVCPARFHSEQSAFPDAQPRHPVGRHQYRSGRARPTVARGERAAAGRGEQLRHHRDQRPHRAGGAAGGRGRHGPARQA
jgi:hypothetical protein